MPYVQHRGFRLHYTTAGSGPPLVLQHGFTGRARRWRELGYEQTLAQRYRLIMPDALGHGASDRPRDPQAYSETARCEDLLAILDREGVERAHLFGYSMGGRLVLRTAILHPERVASIVVGGIHPFLPPEGRAPFDRRLFVALVGSAERRPLRLRLRDRALGEGMRWAFRLRGKGDLRAYSAFARYSRDNAVSLEEHLPGIRQPCLIFGGESDPIAPATLLARFADAVPDAESFLVPGAGHDAVERRDEVLARVVPFLERAVAAEQRRGGVTPEAPA